MASETNPENGAAQNPLASGENEKPDSGTKNDEQGETAAAPASPENRNKEKKGNGATPANAALTPIDNPQNLPPVYVGVKDKPEVKEPSLPIIGFNLSSFVLLIISGFILFLAIYLFTKEFDASARITIPTQANISDSTYNRRIELVRMIQEEKKNYREFTMQMAQMVLLNLLLPVLTAILGYIFASNKNGNT